MIRHGWRPKEKSLTASEADRPDVSALRATMVEFHQELCAASDMVFVDESGANITHLRARGRAKAGERVGDNRPVNRGKNQTYVGALTIKGMQAVRIMDGAMTSERFDEWVIADLSSQPSA